ncbi:GGDEF domain-containing protein [Vibrio hippocampi]|uniref:GGDEF domain-containing protein n=1 Tax=Vibrio hippocampi TaxID=654686 RepID=A0ABM8ZL26_9VIBR|nr:sensor domain-containing diguanylate cyclase [Vibrio hippocampi]CAH0528974.1 hypothetical protein VHP8226_02987 [Vibrio hippocampi]
MQPAPIPQDDESRIRAIRQLRISQQSEERFDRITRLAKRMFNVDMALVTVIDRDTQWFKSVMGFEGTQTGRDISFCGHAILGDEPFIVPDASRDRRFFDNPQVVDEPNIRFYAGVPLKLAQGFKIGTLCIVDSRPRHFSDQDVSDLMDLANLAESELAANLDSTIDELTQISNRRGFITLADKVIQNCRFRTEPFSLALFDLDKFKLINDNLGHSVGDEALTTFACLLTENFRDSDVIARIGGDEFVVLMSGTTDIEAQTPLSRFEEHVSQFNRNEKSSYELSYSVGVVCCSPLEEVSHQDMLQRADQAMYLCKRSR